MYGNNPVSAIRIQLVDANNYRVHERTLNNNVLLIITDINSLYSLDLSDYASVKKLYVDNNNLDSIPESILRMVNLEHIDLSGNNLKRIPDYIKDFEKLSSINLSSNNLLNIEQVLCVLKDCPELKELFINDVGLYTLPDSIVGLNNLEMLSINDNHLRSLSGNIVCLGKLKFLFATDNMINKLPDNLDDLPHKLIMELSGNPLPDEYIDSILNKYEKICIGR